MAATNERKAMKVGHASHLPLLMMLLLLLLLLLLMLL
jgi:hypothetical protein